MAFAMGSLKGALPSCQPSVARASLPTYTGMACRPLQMRAEGLANNIVLGPQNGATVFAMRHQKKVAKLGKPADQRKALLRSLTTEVLRHGKITTTVTRAKAVRSYVDKMITLSKRGTLHAKRQMEAFVYDKELVERVFNDAPKRYEDRQGGYCRVKKEIQRRRGDNAEMATIELV